MRKIALEPDVSNQSERRVAKQELGLMPYNIQKALLLRNENKCVRLQQWRQLIHRSLLCSGSGWSLQMRSCSLWNKHTNAKTTGAGPHGLPAHQPSSNTAKISSASLYSAKVAQAAGHAWISRNTGSESTRMCTDAISSRPWYFCGPSISLTMRNGRSSRIPLQATGQKRLRSGAESFSSFHHNCRMAAVLSESKPDGLHRMVAFGGQGLC